MEASQWKILVAEDEFDSIKMVSKILTHHDIQVQIVHNGKECLKALEESCPTLIILDLAMPEMDGWETLVALRSNPETAHIPVVAITAYHSADVAEDAQQAGFDAYFSKPIDPRLFVKQLSEVVE